MKARFSPTRLLLSAALLLFFIPMSAQWNNIAPNNGGSNIQFVSGSVGYIQDIYRMQKTIDGGVTWTTLDSNSTTYVRQDMYWLNANEGFVVMYENLGFGNYAGWFKKTSNGGATWSAMSQLPVNEWYNAIWFVTSLEGYVVGSGGTILKTTNGGSSWVQLTSGTTLDLYTIFFVSATTAWVGGDDGIILQTMNSGNTWTNQFQSVSWEFNDLFFTDVNNGVAVGTYGMMRTTNGGTNWIPVTGTNVTQFLAVHFPSADTGYVTAVGGNVFRTVDAGVTWLGLNRVGLGYFVRDVYFLSNDTGFVLADYSGVWKTTNAGNGCPTLTVQSTASAPDTLFTCAGRNVVFSASPSAANTYSIGFNPASAIDTALSYYMYYYAVDSVAGDTMTIQITMTDPFTGCPAVTDSVVIITDSLSYQPPPMATQLVPLCPGDSVTLDLGAFAQNGYMWLFTGDTTQIYVTDTIGLYNGMAYACGSTFNWIFVVQWDTNCAQVCAVDAGPDTTFCQQQGQLSATPASPGNYSFVWSPAAGLDNPYVQNPNVVNGIHNQQYIVMMIDSAAGCTAYDTVVVSAYYFTAGDTTYNCNNSPVTLDFGPGASNYYWQFFTDTAGNTTSLNQTTQTLTVTQPGSYVGFAMFPGCGALTNVFYVADSCNVYVGNVWPGDCNYDLIVNMADALHIGLAYSASGATRPNASNLWYAQPMVDWSQSYVNCNYKHGDADGSGNINVNDTLPISLNYSLTHPFRLGAPEVPAAAPSLKLVCSVDTVGLETLVLIDVVLGTVPSPVDSLYGISFRITSDAFLIDTTLTAINANTTWLGNTGNMFTFQKHFPSAGITDFAEVKTNHVNTFNGQGVLASYFIVTTDNLSGIQTCHFNLSEVTAVTKSQVYLPVNTENDSVVIDPGAPAGIHEPAQTATFSIYPNPANENISVVTSPDVDVIEICDVTGRVVQSVRPTGSNTLISTSSLAEGMYLVRVKNGNSIVTQKLTIAR